MRIAVVIATHGRKAMVGQLLAHLEHQKRRPDEVILSVPDANDVDEPCKSLLDLKTIIGPKGLCRQRNEALEYVMSRFDVVTFFDDDFLPADDYLARLEQLLTAHKDWSVVTGLVIKDGARTTPISFVAGVEALKDPYRGRSADIADAVYDLPGVYGCNMSIRVSAIGDVRFDERLALYGWQEDVDFTSQLRSTGRVVLATALCGVHLGVTNGRVSGYRLGYSQVVNPIYLIRKRTIGLAYGLTLLCRNLASNAVRSLWPEPHVDRRGRLRGNLLGLAHIAIGRVEPERILRL
jgi:glycosyltransferase involved in cell wall biosynthesis